ncbi:MAG: hypothetical protein KGZ58_04305 [Ignavibacteriales bacterium]|nr:hypothetical protein [Ignavibacteriales bacterium]
MTCPKCSNKTIFDFSRCPSCGLDISKGFDIKTGQTPTISKDNEITPSPLVLSTNEPGSGAISVLRFFAWLNLVAGIIGAIYIWSNFATEKILKGTYYSYAESVTNPLGVAIGVAVFLEGIFACALFLVIANIAENLIAIRLNTTPSE